MLSVITAQHASLKHFAGYSDVSDASTRSKGCSRLLLPLKPEKISAATFNSSCLCALRNFNSAVSPFTPNVVHQQRHVLFHSFPLELSTNLGKNV